MRLFHFSKANRQLWLVATKLDVMTLFAPFYTGEEKTVSPQDSWGQKRCGWLEKAEARLRMEDEGLEAFERKRHPTSLLVEPSAGSLG